MTDNRRKWLCESVPAILDAKGAEPIMVIGVKPGTGKAFIVPCGFDPRSAATREMLHLLIAQLQDGAHGMEIQS